MATYDDLASGLNNSAGLSLADALDVRNANVRLPSLAEQKNSRLAGKLAEKQTRLDPNFQQFPAVPDVDFFGGNDTGLAELAHASLNTAGGNVLDAVKGISNKLLGSEFDDSAETGFSNQSLADMDANVSLPYRQNLQQDQHQVLQDIKDDNYWEATKSAGNVAFRTAADSAGTLPELALGAALTPVAGAGLAVIGNKFRKMSNTAEAIYDTYSKIKKTKAGELIGKGVKESGRASVITADIVQQQRNQYKAENNGEEMSATRLAGATLLTLATTIWQPSIARKLYMPKLPGATSKIDGGFRKRIAKEIQAVVDTSNNGVMKNLALRVAEGIKGTVKAGGAEAVQEYAQFWAETLAVKMKPDEVTSFMQSALNQFQDQGNIDQAIQSAFLGGAAGGATKIAVSAPSNVIGATVDTALSVSTKVGKNLKQRANDAMSDSDILSMTARDKSQARANKKFKERSIVDIETINNAKTINDISNKSLVDQMTKLAKGRDLNNTEVFNSVKKQAMSALKAKAASATIATTANRVAGVSTRAAKAVAERAEEFAKTLLTPEEIEKVKALPGKVKESVIAEIKDFPKSTTRGLFEAAGNYSVKKTKEGLSELRTQAKASGIKASRKLAEIIKDDAPDVAKALNESADIQERNAKAAGLRTDNLTTNDNLSSNIRQAASVGVNTDTIDQTMAEVYEAGYGEFDSQKTVDTVTTAIKNIQGTQEYKDLPLDERTAFSALESNLRRKVGPKSQDTTEKVKGAVKKAVSEVGKQVNKVLDIVPTKKGESDTSLTNIALRAINDAFVKFSKDTSGVDTHNQLVVTDPSKATKGSVKVYAEPEDPNSKLIASIPNTPALKQLKKLFGAAQITANDTGDNSGLGHYVDAMTNAGPGLDMLTKAVGSTDPIVIQALLTHIAEDLSKPEFANKIKKNLTAALQNLETKPNVKTKPEVKVKAENKPEPKSVEQKKEFEIDENGEKMAYSKEAITKEDESFIDSLLNPVCGI